MKKTVSPAVAIALIVVVVIIAVVLFTRAARGRRVQFIPGVGVIDPRTGQPMGRGAGGRGARGGEPAEAGAPAEGRGGGRRGR